MSLERYRKKKRKHFKRGVFLNLIVASIVLVGYGRSVGLAKEPPTDTQIRHAIETELLLDSAVSPHLIDVKVNRGVVSLTGTVSNLLERDRAVDVAGATRGVRSIINRLEVRAVERSDAEIKKDVDHALLFDPATDLYEVTVQVEDGVVTLDGTVESWAEKLLATEVVKGVKGVTEVKNGIKYSFEADRSDRQIKTDIEGRLEMDPYVDEELVHVAVDDGVVKLSGTVGSVAEKNLVVTKARVPGIMRVLHDDLEVAGWAQGTMERRSKMVTVSDDEVEKAIEQAFLYDPRLLSFEIDVDVVEGVATLTGTVDNLKAKRSAESDALHTRGVYTVSNRIKVRPNDNLTDEKIAENVREALVWDPIVERFDISVWVRNRRVSLTGVVDTAMDKARAEDAASRVNGVASVDNRLVVKQRPIYKTDSEIKDDIESQYAWSPFVDGGDLEVRVDDGQAEIAGRVDTWHEYREAVENAFEGGAQEVRSTMRVEANDRVYDRSWSEPPEEVWPF